MPVYPIWFASFFVLSMFNAVLNWRLYSRWRRVRYKGTGALPLNQSLLNAIENNQHPLGSSDGPFARERRSWVTLRLLLTGEHHALNDEVLTRRVYTLRLTTVLAFALFFAPFAFPLLHTRS